MKKNYLRVVVMVLILTMLAGMTAFAISPETDNNGGAAVGDGRISPMKYQSGEYAAKIESANIQKVGEVVFADVMNDIKKGKQVAIGLYVEDLGETYDDIRFAEARGQGVTVAASVDIEMYRRIDGVDSNVELDGTSGIPFTLKVPNELAKVSGLKVYYMRPNAEGIYEVVEVPATRIVKDEGVFLTMTVRHFTPFQIVYEKGAAADPLFDDTGKEPVQQPGEQQGQQPGEQQGQQQGQQSAGDKKPEGAEGTAVPKTADAADMALWFMMAVSACGAGFVAVAKKKAVR